MNRIKQTVKPYTIMISMGTCGLAAGAQEVCDEIKTEIKRLNIEDKFEIIETGCMGLCHSEPTIELVDTKSKESVFYGNLTPKHARSIITSDSIFISSLKSIDKIWYYPEVEENKENFLQAKIVLRNCGRIDPENIDHYIANDGYRALKKALKQMTPELIVKEVKKSGLKGRGGGGFSTGKKWSFAAEQTSTIKYVVCNADEGDPGAFMDRAVLEGDPHAVLEAMTIAGYAIGATKGIIYIRAEYPLAIQRLVKAITQSQQKGFLGNNIFDSNFNFNIELKFGAGAFVCGEETALIHSIEGLRGAPTFRPPFPAVSGLWKKPTIVNNVETFANICPIIRKGSDWFRKMGTEHSPGTKVFSLAGKIKKVGLIEVPIGTSMKKIVYDIGEGVSGKHKLKAVQAGGPSGGCITSDHIDIPVDYDTLKSLGSMMGSGGIIIMDEKDCMVGIAKYFLEFTVEESCGKCTPCRIGGKHMQLLLTKITEGKGTHEDLQKLQNIAKTIKATSLCGLGMTAPNPVLSTLRYFKDEYNEHINEKKCRAESCIALIKYEIIAEKCVGCSACVKICPSNCISGKRKEIHKIDNDKCIKCGQCMNKCKFNAIIKKA